MCGEGGGRQSGQGGGSTNLKDGVGECPLPSVSFVVIRDKSGKKGEDDKGAKKQEGAGGGQAQPGGKKPQDGSGGGGGQAAKPDDNEYVLNAEFELRIGDEAKFKAPSSDGGNATVRAVDEGEYDLFAKFTGDETYTVSKVEAVPAGSFAEEKAKAGDDAAADQGGKGGDRSGVKKGAQDAGKKKLGKVTVGKGSRITLTVKCTVRLQLQLVHADGCGAKGHRYRVEQGKGDGAPRTVAEGELDETGSAVIEKNDELLPGPCRVSFFPPAKDPGGDGKKLKDDAKELAEALKEFKVYRKPQSELRMNEEHKFRLPRVFTVFCHGTGGHRDGKCLELITEFGGAYWSDKEPRYRAVGYGPGSDAFYNEHYQKTFLILDGPGKTDMFDNDNKPIGQAKLPHLMPGDFKPDDLKKPQKPHRSALKFTPTTVEWRVSQMPSRGTGQHRGSIMGDGWNDNVCHALFVLKELLKEDKFPEVVNLIGWSRGAVTTLKTAYWIQRFFLEGKPFTGPKDYRKEYADYTKKKEWEHTYLPALSKDELDKVPKDLEANIFAIDPVPGRFGKNGNWAGSSSEKERFPDKESEKDYQSILPVVNDCVITLAMDEIRKGFAPIDKDKVKDLGGANVVWLPYPGIHRTQLRTQPRDPTGKGRKVEQARQDLRDVPRIVWDLAWKFLTHHGTRFKRWLPTKHKGLNGCLDIYSVVEAYSGAMLNREGYHAIRNKGQRIKGGGLHARQFTGYTFPSKFLSPAGDHSLERLFPDKLGAYSRNPKYFVNEHHRLLFEKAYPYVNAYLFTLMPGDRAKQDEITVGCERELETMRVGTLQLLQKHPLEKRANPPMKRDPGSLVYAGSIRPDAEWGRRLEGMGLLEYFDPSKDGGQAGPPPPAPPLADAGVAPEDEPEELEMTFSEEEGETVDEDD